MNEGLIPRRYAKALFKVDSDHNTAARTYAMMQTLVKSFATNPALREMVANPFIASADKDRILATAAGANTTDAGFFDFLKLLHRNRRIDMIEQIALAYLDIYRQANHIRRVEVVSAAALDPTVEQRIKAVVNSHLHGDTMEFDSHVDPELIGGFVVNIDNERLDASLSHSLKELRLSLLK